LNGSVQLSDFEIRHYQFWGYQDENFKNTMQGSKQFRVVALMANANHFLFQHVTCFCFVVVLLEFAVT
jgi:hypothetical protein